MVAQLESLLEQIERQAVLQAQAFRDYGVDHPQGLALRVREEGSGHAYESVGIVREGEDCRLKNIPFIGMRQNKNKREKGEKEADEELYCLDIIVIVGAFAGIGHLGGHCRRAFARSIRPAKLEVEGVNAWLCIR